MRKGEILCHLNDFTAIIYIVFSHWLQNMRFLSFVFAAPACSFGKRLPFSISSSLAPPSLSRLRRQPDIPDGVRRLGNYIREKGTTLLLMRSAPPAGGRQSPPTEGAFAPLLSPARFFPLQAKKSGFSLRVNASLRFDCSRVSMGHCTDKRFTAHRLDPLADPRSSPPSFAAGAPAGRPNRRGRKAPFIRHPVRVSRHPLFGPSVGRQKKPFARLSEGLLIDEKKR
mgnify:FL=1